jgi:hypothetical protein
MLNKTFLLPILTLGSLVTLNLTSSAKAAIIASFDFDPDAISGTQVDIDDSAQTNWTTSILLDNATGTGAVGQGNQTITNRDLTIGNTNNLILFSSNREGDSGTPTGTIGESTWLTFSVTPSANTSFDFTGENATIDTYALNTLGGVSSTDWILYFSLDGGTSYTSLGTFAGQSATASAGLTGPLQLSWSLDTIGVQTGTVDFLIDPVSTGGTNGAVSQRSTGFDNLLINATVTTSNTQVPEPSSILALFGLGLGFLATKGKNK